MNRFTVVLVLVLWGQFSVAQTVNLEEAANHMAAERARIQTEREAGETRFNQHEVACYAMFAVIDCLEEVKFGRRQMLDDLRRQTVILNEMERQRKSHSKIEMIKRKSDLQKMD